MFSLCSFVLFFDLEINGLRENDFRWWKLYLSDFLSLEVLYLRSYLISNYNFATPHYSTHVYLIIYSIMNTEQTNKHCRRSHPHSIKGMVLDCGSRAAAGPGRANIEISKISHRYVARLTSSLQTVGREVSFKMFLLATIQNISHFRKALLIDPCTNKTMISKKYFA